MRYSAHVGPTEEAWPRTLSEHRTREEAQRAVKTGLRVSPPTHTKGQVRIGGALLLDVYARLPTGTVRHVYAAKQRVML